MILTYHAHKCSPEGICFTHSEYIPFVKVWTCGPILWSVGWGVSRRYCRSCLHYIHMCFLRNYMKMLLLYHWSHILILDVIIILVRFACWSQKDQHQLINCDKTCLCQQELASASHFIQQHLMEKHEGSQWICKLSGSTTCLFSMCCYMFIFVYL